MTRREEYQRQKRHSFYIQLSLVIFLIIALICGTIYIAHRLSLRISAVTVSGGLRISADDLSHESLTFLSGSYLFAFPKNNALIYPHDALETYLKDHFKRIDTISVTRTNFHTLNVAITERKPVALWCGAAPTHPETCYFMDNTSTIFAEAPEFSGDAYFKYYGEVPLDPIGSQYLASSTEFADLAVFVAATRDLNLRPEYLITQSSPETKEIQGTLVISGGGKIYFDTQIPLQKVVENLKALLLRTPGLTPSLTHALPIDYIDLRYGNKLFYKLLHTATSTTL